MPDNRDRFIDTQCIKNMPKQYTDKDWQNAHKVIDTIKQQQADKKKEEMMNFIEKYERTFWKAVMRFQTTYFHVWTDKDEGRYAYVYMFETHTNKVVKIKRQIMSRDDLLNYLDGVSIDTILEDRYRRENDDEYYDDDELPEYPKSTVTKITEQEFKKEVQAKILDAWSIGLTFK